MSEKFERCDLGGAVFHEVNLGKAVFDDVNLGGAAFKNVNLGGASIANANLENFSIIDAGIRGMTIYGMRIDLLIEAELDRRDPERLRLRMADRYDPQCVRTVMAALDELRTGFCALLRSTDAERLARRPAAEEWSVIEILRHLVFAEDMYLNRWILRNDKPLYALGQLPAFLAHDPRYASVGSQPTTDLETVLAAWQDIHAHTQEYLVEVTAEMLRQDTRDVDFGQGTVGGILQGMAQHDLLHIRDAERLIARL